MRCRTPRWPSGSPDGGVSASTRELLGETLNNMSKTISGSSDQAVRTSPWGSPASRRPRSRVRPRSLIRSEAEVRSRRIRYCG